MDPVTYNEAIACARECIMHGDPITQDNEYVRGVCNVIAEMFGEFEMDTGDRMTQVAHAIGLPHIHY